MKTINLETRYYDEALRDRLEFEQKVLQQEGLEVQVEEYQQEARVTFVFKSKLEEDKLWAIVKEYIANAVSDVIINQVEKKKLARFLRTNYQEFSAEEREQILQFAYDRLNSLKEAASEMTATLRRKNQVATKILNYLREENKINLEGFAEFRLKKYVASLKLAVEEAVDEYLIEQEYQQFVDLLEDIIEEQPRHQQVVNVVRTEQDNFQLIDNTGAQITDERLEEYLDEETGIIETEDKLISALISLAFEEVILHFEASQSMVEILKNIYEDKLSICPGCEYCSENNCKYNENGELT